MPISPIVLQRRHAELGRIRLGAKTTYSNGKEGPKKLEQFRFTSHSERYIRDLASLYGGEPRQWDNNGVASWEVYTDATTVPVIAVKGGLSQWMETWSGGGCIHRCDGERDAATGELCNPQDPAHVNAKPTTRLSVMLPELEAIGVWRLESHGWNAAAEIPAVAELAQYVGDLVPAHLNLVERRAIKDGKTSRFVVPVLDLQIGTARLREIVAQASGASAAIESSAVERPQLEARPQAAIAAPPAAEDVLAPYYADLNAAQTPDDCMAIYQRAKATGLFGAGDRVESNLDLYRAIGDRGRALKAQSDAATGADAPRGRVDADPDEIWNEILKAAGQQGMTLTQVEQHFSARNGGIPSAEASPAELAAYLDLLQNGVAA